jgi:hypothetical protein
MLVALILPKACHLERAPRPRIDTSTYAVIPHGGILRLRARTRMILLPVKFVSLAFDGLSNGGLLDLPGTTPASGTPAAHRCTELLRLHPLLAAPPAPRRGRIPLQRRRRSCGSGHRQRHPASSSEVRGTVPGAEKYPHIYGALPMDAVTGVIAVSRDAAGRLVLPE